MPVLALYNNASRYHQAGDLATAIKLYEEALGANPEPGHRMLINYHLALAIWEQAGLELEGVVYSINTQNAPAAEKALYLWLNVAKTYVQEVKDNPEQSHKFSSLAGNIYKDALSATKKAHSAMQRLKLAESSQGQAERSKASGRKGPTHKSLIKAGRVYWVSLTNGDKLLFKILEVQDDYFRALPLIPSEPTKYGGEPTTILCQAIVSIDEAGPPWSYYSEGEMYSKKAGAEKDGGCFIATAAYRSPVADEVSLLRTYRDQVLAKSWPGRLIVSTYYRLSPSLAQVVDSRSSLRSLTRLLLKPVVGKVKRSLSDK